MKEQKEPLTGATANGSGTNNQQTNSTPSSTPSQAQSPMRLSESQVNSQLVEMQKRVAKDATLRRQLIGAKLTDAGNGECFVFLYQDSLRYCKTIGKWLKWEGNKWKIDADGEAHVAAIVTARIRNSLSGQITDDDERNKLRQWANQSEAIARRAAMLNTAMHMKPIAIIIDELDRNPFLAAVKNGTLDLKKGEFRESKREDNITKQFDVEFDRRAKAPLWEKFLDEIFAGDKELISYLQRAVGYCLTGDTREQVFFIFYGKGANGKSLFIDVISTLLGDYAMSTPFSTFEAKNRGDSSNDLARLRGARFVSSIETNEDRRLDEARVKSVTGQDEITARFLFQEYFSFRPNFKIWMAVNHKPLIKGTDRGIWRRIRLIPFTQNFEGKADKELIFKLKAELPGILNWALEGLREWREKGLGTAKAIEQSSDEYRRESDLVQQWMDELVTLETDSITPSSDAYNSFKEWSKNRGYPIFSINSFARAMTEKGFERKSTGKQRVYRGLKLD